MSNTKIVAGIITLVIIILALLVIGGIDNGRDHVTIGYLPSDHDAALFVANANQMYQKNGIKVELHEYNNGGDLISAMASGGIDVGYVGLAPTVTSINKGVPIKIVAGAQNEGSGLVTNDPSVKSIQDLKGQTIATPGEASIQNVLLKYDLKKNGMKVSDVNSPGMKVSSLSDALKTGSIKGGLLYEPYVSQAVDINNLTLVEKSSEILPNHPCCVVVMSDKFIKNNRTTARKILDIHKNATEMIMNNTNKTVEYLPSHIILNPEAEKESLNEIKWVSDLNDTYKENVNNFLNIEKDLGIITEIPPNEKLYAQI